MNQMTAAAKVAKLREMAKDKSLPQDVRNTYLDEAVKLEEKGAMKAGVKMAKGGAVKAAPKKTAGKPMMYGGAVAKDLPMRGSRTATNMAKGGSATKKAKK
jgi:hypothetical protein